MNKDTAEFFSQAIIGEILNKGTVTFLIERLRYGQAKFITQEAWNIVAEYLEGKHRKKGRPEENHWHRDKQIINKFNELRSKKVKQEEAYHEAAKCYGINEEGLEQGSSYSVVQAVVNKERKNQKLIIAMQNDETRYNRDE